MTKSTTTKLRTGALALALALGLVPFAMPAQEPPQQGGDSAPSAEQPEPAEQPPARQGENAQRPAPPPPPSARGAARPRNDDSFTPSEELQADEEVTFPVDI